MRLLSRLVAGGGVAAFFFFSWVIMTLWNTIVAGYLELAKPLSYLQTCGLWFMLILLFSWTGIAVRWTFRRGWSSEGRGEDVGREVERRIKRAFARWADTSEDLTGTSSGSGSRRGSRRRSGSGSPRTKRRTERRPIENAQESCLCPVLRESPTPGG